MRSATRLDRPQRLRLTLRGWGCAAAGLFCIGVAAWLGRVDALFIGIFLFALPSAAVAMLMVYRPRLSVSRGLSAATIPAGTAIHVRLTVRNLSRRSLPVLIWRDGRTYRAATPEARIIPWLSEHRPRRTNGEDTVVLGYPLTEDRRGVHPVGPTIVRRYDPLACARSEYTVSRTDALVVLPRVTVLEHMLLDLSTHTGQHHQMRRRDAIGVHEFGAREYRVGDPIRRVHWKATAHHSTLMVRQEEQPTHPSVILLLDTFVPGGSRGPDTSWEAVFEQSVRLAASIGVHFLTSGFAVRLILTGDVDGAGRGRPDAEPLAVQEFRYGADATAFLTALAGARPAPLRPSRGPVRPPDTHTTDARAPVIALLNGMPHDGFQLMMRRHDRHDVRLVFAHDPSFAAPEKADAPAVEPGLDGWDTVRVGADEPPESAWRRACMRNGAVSRV